jgi:uncharacterized membrane protein
MLENYSLGSPHWLIAAVVLVAMAAFALAWGLIKCPARSLGVWFSALLKLVAIASIGLYLVEPLVRSERPQPGANLLAIAVDNSRSMGIRTPGATASFMDRLRTQLQPDAGWQKRAAQDFTIRRYAFDTRPRAIDGFDQLTFDGQSSAVGATIDQLTRRYAHRPSVGLLLITDGISTDELPLTTAAGSSMPVYPIVDMRRSDVRDISVMDATATQSAFEIAPVRVEATIAADGLRGEEITARLLDEEGGTLATEKIMVDSDRYRKRVQFQTRPKQLGIQFVTVRARLSSEDDAKQPVADSRQEMTLENNSRLVAVDRGGGPYRILYVAGRTNWEFKFLRRALEEDEQLQCVGLIRIAKKEAKFSFRDRQVESINPLFAGFENDDPDAKEQYDEPILLTLGVTDDDDALKSGFPKTDEVLFRYDALILDDIEAKFFTPAQQLLIRRFVSERGGGLLMLGGPDTFDSGGYRDTPLADLLPVYLRGNRGEAVDQSVAYRLTREGSLQPWLRLRPSETAEAQRLAGMPAFLTWNPVQEVKPGASILATLAIDEQRSLPGLVTQQFGNGRAAAFLLGDLWRWGLRREHSQNDDLAQTWRQIARWLTSDVLQRLHVEVQPATTLGKPTQLSITVRDERYKALDNAQLKIDVLQPDGILLPASAEPDRQRPGLYHARFWSNQDGPYVASIAAEQPDGTSIASREVGWTAEPSAAEFRVLTPDLAPLQELAQRSGGEVVDIDDLERFAASLPTRQVPVREVRVEPVWHRSLWLLLSVCCLCGEWAIRRLRGLP